MTPNNSNNFIVGNIFVDQGERISILHSSAALALLAFWGPYTEVGGTIRPHFDLLLLLTGSDYGLTFCFTTPVFLLGLILIHPHVNQFAYRVTVFSGLLYGLFNLTHWFNPATQWMGFLHLPLLVISVYALIMPGLSKLPSQAEGWSS